MSAARPTSQHRLSVGSGNASSLPRGSYSRTHSHSASLSAVNPTNRINRRKSSTFSPAAKPALTGAAVENAVADGSAAINRRSSMSKAALAALNDGSTPSSLPHHVSAPDGSALSSSVVVDGAPLSSYQGSDKSKQKMRRASEGGRLSKNAKAASGDLKCETCGKAYKHGSCLTKHLWEHTPEWQLTSKLLISKHQQVQLLEAASVLVAMNQDGPNDSDNSSSPAASGSSERDEELSSTETTPPPQSDTGYRDSKRFSNNSSVFSRSYQSVFSESAPVHDPGFAHHRQWSASSTSRPVTANTAYGDSYRGDEDPADLAAAVGLLSCSYGTPKSGPNGITMDVPPVPPLPAKYQNYHTQGDVHMEDDDDSDDEPHARNDDMEDHGVFGKMDA